MDDDAALHAAQERLDLADRRIVALLEAGVLEAGALINPLRQARECLAASKSAEALELCNTVLDRARALAERGGGPAAASRPPERVRTDRHARPGSGRHAVPEPHSIDPTIAQAAQAGLIGKDVTQLESRLESRLESTLAAHSTAVREDLEQRTTALSAQMGELKEALTAVIATVAASATPAPTKDPHLDALLASQSADLREELNQRTAGISAQLSEFKEALATVLATVEAAASMPKPVENDTHLDEALASQGAILRDELQVRLADQDQQLTALREQLTSVHIGLPAVLGEAIGSEVRKALGDLPLRQDLEQLTDGLRKDLDWQIERIAAERGWVTINDVQSTISGQGHLADSSHAPSPAVFARLEAALTQFVQQNHVSQERFLNAIQQRFDHGTRAMTQNIITAALSRMPATRTPLHTPATPPAADHDDFPTDEEQIAAAANAAARGPDADLDVLSQSSQFRVLGQEPTLRPGTDGGGSEDFADASTTRRLPLSKPDHQAINLAAPPTEVGTAPMHREIAPDVSENSAEPTPDDIIAQVAAELSAGGTSKAVRSTVMPSPARDIEAKTPEAADPEPESAPIAATTPMPDELSPLKTRLEAIEARLAERVAPPVPSTPIAPTSSLELGRELLLHLLTDPAVRQQILGLVATEAVANPGALGELTGIRAFIRREIQQSAEEVSAAMRREMAPEATSL